MTHWELYVAAIVLLLVGFAGDFVLRPVIAPAQQTSIVLAAPPAAQVSRDARGVQYFIANIDEARLVVAGCREGSVRDGECANAGAAIITAESKERFKRFRTAQ